jgi:hypothetical protein
MAQCAQTLSKGSVDIAIFANEKNLRH